MPFGDENKEKEFVRLFWENHKKRAFARWGASDPCGWVNESDSYLKALSEGMNPDRFIVNRNVINYGQLPSSYAKYQDVIMPIFRAVGSPPGTCTPDAAPDFEGYTSLGVHPSLISTNRSELDSYYAKLDWKSKTKLNPALNHARDWLGNNTRTAEEPSRDKVRVVRFANMPMMIRNGDNDPSRPDQRIRAGGSLKFDNALVNGKATPALYQSYIARSKGRVVEIDFCQEAYRELTQAFINIREVYGDNMIVAIPSLCYINCVHFGHYSGVGGGVIPKIGMTQTHKGGGVSPHWNYRAIDFDINHNPWKISNPDKSDIWKHSNGCYKPAIEILEYYGFEWGFRWSIRDTMHIDCG